jgi:serine/threonine-protein kinase
MADASVRPQLDAMNYRVINTLGTGAGSTILLISDKKAGGHRYALKIVKRQSPADDIYIAQARIEYEVAQRLRHPNILKIYDCRTKRAWFRITSVELLMEYVNGRTLDELEEPRLGKLVLIFNQAAAAVAHMHRRGVYHGDLKPSNIMLAQTGRVKLIDFGTAWIRGQEKNRVQGTPQYIAPEQVSAKIVDQRTDIYNFGATMYRMFTGQFANRKIPKSGETPGQQKLLLTAPIKLNPRIPRTLNETIMACLEPCPESRPADMHEVKHQLVAVARSMGLNGQELRETDTDEA